MKNLFCLLCFLGWIIAPTYAQFDKLPKTIDEQTVFNNVDKMPQMPDGTSVYFLTHVHFDENESPDFTGKIVCYFIIDTFGKVREPIVKAYNEAIKKQVIDLLINMPLWQPAIKNRKKVPANFAIPLQFCF